MIRRFLFWLCSIGWHQGGGDFVALFTRPRPGGGWIREEMFECKRCGKLWLEDMDTWEEKPWTGSSRKS